MQVFQLIVTILQLVANPQFLAAITALIEAFQNQGSPLQQHTSMIRGRNSINV